MEFDTIGAGRYSLAGGFRGHLGGLTGKPQNDMGHHFDMGSVQSRHCVKIYLVYITSTNVGNRGFVDGLQT